MYIDESIPLPSNLPKILVNDFAVLQEYYDNEDWISFDIYWEGVEATVKACHIAGTLTRKDALQIMHRYGIY